MEPPRAECHAREVALAPPRALGCELLTGALRRTPEDFEVEEDLGFEPSGAGAHVLLKVRKRDANTAWVAGALARAAGCRTAEVGYAGLKDRRAIATQWFSVPRPRSAPEWIQLRGEGFEVLEAHAHGRKLPRGALAGNRFRVRIHAESGGGRALADALAPGLGAIARAGIPNYFGPQRFGREGANLARAQLPLAGLRPDERTFVLSAARSVIFNAVLARRVRAGTWGHLERGDLANLDGRGSVFAVAALDAELTARAARLEIHPTGPMWGQGAPASGGCVQALEIAAAAQLPTQAGLCTAARMHQERRSLRLAVHALELEVEPAAVRLHFRLTRGAFATAVLRELLAEVSASALD